jgi:acyl transferase domain-containing protein
MRETRKSGVADTDMLSVLRQLRDKITSLEQERREPIAIVGIGCRLPGGVHSPDALWQFLASAGDGVGEIPDSRWQPDDFYHPDPAAVGRMNVRHAGFIDGVREFDPYFFGISPRETSMMDPQQRMFLEVAWEALEDAGQADRDVRASATGVFVGANGTDYLQLQLAEPTGIGNYTVSGGANCIIANRLSYQLDLRGPSLTIDTACSSSLVAVHLAVQSLRGRECDMAIVGGVNLILSPFSMVAHAKGLPLAPDGRCKTFDARADGYVRGEGVVAVVLRRLSDAVAAGDRIWAVIRGSAVNQDGLTNGLTAPNGLAQRAVIERALANARVSAADVTLLEAHGTGTALGDPIEVETLDAVYGKRDGDSDRCALGAIKSNIGHLEAAAGLAGLIKTALCIHHRTIAANLHLESLNPLISLDGSRLFVPTTGIPWDRPDEQRHAAVSSFGAGGTNAHVILGAAPAEQGEAAPAGAPDDEARVLYAIPVSARTPDALDPMAREYRDYLESAAVGGRSLRDIAFSATVRRTQHEHRAVVVADSPVEAAGRLGEWLAKKEPPGVFAGRASGAAGKRIVFVFPGQGAQRPGMGRELMRECSAFRGAVIKCDQAMMKWLGYSVLGRIHGTDDESDLSLDVIQPALFAVAVGLAARWKSLGIQPDVVVGHSMGEVAAAYVAGALTLDDATRVICRRSALLARVSGRGAMLVVALPMAEARRLVDGHGDRVAVAVSNSPTSTVLSGDTEAIAEIGAALRERNVFARPVRVDVASHSPQVDPLRDDLLTELAGLSPRPSAIPIYSTVTGEMCDGSAFDADYWARNLREPVLFWDAVRDLAGCGPFIEMSPHPTLLSAVEQGFEWTGIDGLALPSMRRDEPEVQTIVEGAAALHASGFPVRLEALLPPGGRLVPLPQYRWAHEEFWFSERPVRLPAPVTGEFAIAPPVLTLASAGEATATDRTDSVGVIGERDSEAAVTGLILSAVAEVLGLSVARIDPELGFFQMGMDSMLAAQLRARLEAELGRKLALPTIYEHPTVSALARHIVGSAGANGAGANGTQPRDGGSPDGHEVPAGLTEDELLAILAEEIGGSTEGAGSVYGS